MENSSAFRGRHERASLHSLSEHLRIGRLTIKERIEQHKIADEERDALRKVKEYIEQESSKIVESFYEEILQQPEAARLIGDSESLRRLQFALKRYLGEIVAAEFDSIYVESRLRIGQVHKRIGVSAKYFLPAVWFLNSKVRSTIMEAPDFPLEVREQAVSAFEKVLFFDLALIFETYIFSLMDDIEGQREELLKYSNLLEQEVAESTKRLQELARKDALTGLFNHRVLMEELRKEVARSTRRRVETTLVFMDVDKFKDLNDLTGHLAGDSCLLELAQCIQNVTRDVDVACRYGGDEFAIILSDCKLDSGVIFCERLKRAVTPVTERFEVALSIGLAVAEPGFGTTADEIVNAADKAMYEAKLIEGTSLVSTVIRESNVPLAFEPVELGQEESRDSEPSTTNEQSQV